MATIPMDVIHTCILHRLPVKTLTRFKSVSKTWETIISSPEFIHLQHNHARSSDTNRLIVFKKGLIFHTHEFDSPETPSLLCHYPQHKPISVDILASSEFFLLINLNHNRELILLNPSTGRHYEIRNLPHQGYNECYGMYLDEVNNDYKVVKIAQTSQDCYDTETSMVVMVYSFRDNSNTNAIERMCCFDIRAEKWTNDVPLPHFNDLNSIKLSVLDGLLCVTVKDTDETGSRNWSVWVMKEYGIKDSWFKLMSFAFDNPLYTLDCYPIAYRTGSRHEILCRMNSVNEYFWYNVIRDKDATRTPIDRSIPRGTIGICKGSLIDFPGGRNMEFYQPK